MEKLPFHRRKILIYFSSRSTEDHDKIRDSWKMNDMKHWRQVTGNFQLEIVVFVNPITASYLRRWTEGLLRRQTMKFIPRLNLETCVRSFAFDFLPLFAAIRGISSHSVNLIYESFLSRQNIYDGIDDAVERMNECSLIVVHHTCVRISFQKSYRKQKTREDEVLLARDKVPFNISTLSLASPRKAHL